MYIYGLSRLQSRDYKPVHEFGLPPCHGYKVGCNYAYNVTLKDVDMIAFNFKKSK